MRFFRRTNGRSRRTRRLLPAGALLGAVLAAGLLAGCAGEDESGSREENVAQAPPPAAQDVPEDEPVAQVASQVEPSVVQVNVEAVQTTPFGPQEQQGAGSGVIYREDGFIVTNAHVVEGADSVNVAFADGTTEQAEVVGADPRTDIAVVRVERDGLPAASFEETGDLTIGQLAVAIGSPSGFESTVTAGVVSGLNRQIPAEFTRGQVPSLVDLVQTDAAISPGSSGGALANRSGEIIGINVAYLPVDTSGRPTENIGFAIPATTATQVADQIIETGEASSPYLGIATADLSGEEAERFGLPAEGGAIVAEVEPGSAAEEAGIEQQDIITALGEDPVENSGDLLAALRGYQPGDTVGVTVIRDGEEQTFDVTLGERSE